MTDNNATAGAAGTSSAETVEQQLAVLNASAGRLKALVEPLSPGELRQSAYPSEWTIAQVLSHLGSGAVIMRGNLDAVLAGGTMEMNDVQAVWDEWNAKSPDDQASDSLRADQALLERLASVTDEERERFRLQFGPVEFDFAGYLGTRVGEHILHSWDVAVVGDPTAALFADGVGLVFDRLALIAGYAGKPTGADRTIRVATTAPTRHADITLAPEAIAFAPGDPTGGSDLTLPTEALIRLVYGRLDPDHTPAFEGAEADLDELRRAYPGV